MKPTFGAQSQEVLQHRGETLHLLALTVFVHAIAAAVKVGAELAKMFGLELPHTLAFDYPTIAALTKFIAGELASNQAAAPLPADSMPLPTAARAEISARNAAEVHATIVAAATGVLGHSVADDVPLVAAGLDSLAAVELSNELNRCVCSLCPCRAPN